MTEPETSAWVEPPEPIGGRDHLGVQAPCTALYAQLLPGITNVTDRARYYSFHPWVIWSFERRCKDHSLDEFRRVLRRSECLFALIALRHERQLGDADEGRHGAALVGRQEFLRIPEDAENIVLEDYAAQDGPRRYFKNKLGGLGQYYFGPLRDLRVLDRAPEGTAYPLRYDRDRGRRLAEALESGVPADAFFQALETPTLTWSHLDELAPFCPCGLVANTGEHNLLLDLFLARTEAFRGDHGLTRRASLGVLLDLVGRDTCDSDYAVEGLLRGAAYSGALPGGSPWQVAPSFERAQRGWGTYQRNELLSLALQGLFAAVLRAVERDRGGRVHLAADAADVVTTLLSAPGDRMGLPLAALLDEVRTELPALTDWSNPSHELQRGWRLQALKLDDDRLDEVARESVAILTALLARGTDEYPYADFALDPEYFDPGEIHLLSFRQAFRNEWSAMRVAEWVRWLAVHWGVGRHLRVALRKLRGEQRDAFRIRPLEGELRVVEVPPPTYTVPRVERCVQILRDLGLVNEDTDRNVSLTALGRVELEACRAQ